MISVRTWTCCRVLCGEIFEVNCPWFYTCSQFLRGSVRTVVKQCPLLSFARRPAVVDKKGDLATLNEVGYQLRI